MARPEASTGEKIGETARNGGIVAAVIGTVAELASLPAGPLVVGGVVLAAGGEIFRRTQQST